MPGSPRKDVHQAVPPGQAVRATTPPGTSEISSNDTVEGLVRPRQQSEPLPASRPMISPTNAQQQPSQAPVQPQPPQLQMLPQGGTMQGGNPNVITPQPIYPAQQGMLPPAVITSQGYGQPIPVQGVQTTASHSDPNTAVHVPGSIPASFVHPQGQVSDPNTVWVQGSVPANYIPQQGIQPPQHLPPHGGAMFSQQVTPVPSQASTPALSQPVTPSIAQPATTMAQSVGGQQPGLVAPTSGAANTRVATTKKNPKATLEDLQFQLNKLHSKLPSHGQPAASQPATPVHTPHPVAQTDQTQVVVTAATTNPSTQPVTASMTTVTSSQAPMAAGQAIHTNPPQIVPPANQNQGHQRQSSFQNVDTYAIPISVSASASSLEVREAAELKPDRRKSDGEVLKMAGRRFQVQKVLDDPIDADKSNENANSDVMSVNEAPQDYNRPRAHSNVSRTSSNELSATSIGRFQVTPTCPVDVLPSCSTTAPHEGQPNADVKEVLTSLVTKTAQTIDNSDRTPSPGASPTHAPLQTAQQHGRFSVSRAPSEDLAQAVNRVNAEYAANRQSPTAQQIEPQRPVPSSTPPIQLEGTTIVESEPSPRDMGTPTRMISVERKSSVVSSISSGRATPDSTTTDATPTNPVAAEMFGYPPGSRMPQQQVVGGGMMMQQPVSMTQVAPPERTGSPGSVVRRQLSFHSCSSHSTSSGVGFIRIFTYFQSI